MCEGSCLSKQAMFCDVEERFAKDFCTLNQTMNGALPLYVPSTRDKGQGKEPQVGPSIPHPRKEKAAHAGCMRTTVVFSGVGPPGRHEAWSRSALPHASSHSCRRDRASPDGRARSVLRHPGVQANLSFPGPSSRRLIQPLGLLTRGTCRYGPSCWCISWEHDILHTYLKADVRLARRCGHSARQKVCTSLLLVLPREHSSALH